MSGAVSIRGIVAVGLLLTLVIVACSDPEPVVIERIVVATSPPIQQPASEAPTPLAQAAVQSPTPELVGDRGPAYDIGPSSEAASNYDTCAQEFAEVMKSMLDLHASLPPDNPTYRTEIRRGAALLIQLAEASLVEASRLDRMELPDEADAWVASSIASAEALLDAAWHHDAFVTAILEDRSEDSLLVANQMFDSIEIYYEAAIDVRAQYAENLEGREFRSKTAGPSAMEEAAAFLGTPKTCPK